MQPGQPRERLVEAPEPGGVLHVVLGNGLLVHDAARGHRFPFDPEDRSQPPEHGLEDRLGRLECGVGLARPSDHRAEQDATFRSPAGEHRRLEETAEHR